MACKPTDCFSPKIVLNVADLGHSGYIDGECVTIEAGGACSILGVGSLILKLQDNDRSLSFLTGGKIWLSLGLPSQWKSVNASD